MLEVISPIAEATQLDVAAEHRLPIAIVGAGSIVDVAHLPAYKRGGLDVVGVFDVDRARASYVAERHGLRAVYSTLDALIGDPDVAVVDIAVPPTAQPEIVEAAVAAGKHVLCQKPLALDPQTAFELVKRVERSGCLAAVNQQLRFSESIAASKAMIEAGWIGTPLCVRFDVDISTDWSAWPWLLGSDRLDVQYHSIHYFDTIRYLVGEPIAAFCRATRFPTQLPRGETRTVSVLVFRGDLQAVVTVNHQNLSNDPKATYRIDGSEGVISGTLGLLYDYPDGRPDTLEVWSRALPTDGWLRYPITTRWLPDAFLGPMGSLLAAIGNKTEPQTSVRDNLGTVALIDALYRSISTSQVAPIEVPSQ